MSKPFIIGIAGESGVGKSTMCDIISLFYGIKNITVISTDDLHKWERNDPMWHNITHLNPDANNLELGDIHIRDLSEGKAIYRSIYNHKTGHFDPPKKIEPHNTILIEGLHAFYTKESQSKIDLKIFVDTNERLRTHWKILRDTEERGYKYNDVLEIIEKRRVDNEKIRSNQLNIADVVIDINTKNDIKILGDKHETVDLTINMKYRNNISQNDLIDFIEEKYRKSFGG